MSEQLKMLGGRQLEISSAQEGKIGGFVWTNWAAHTEGHTDTASRHLEIRTTRLSTFGTFILILSAVRLHLHAPEHHETSVEILTSPTLTWGVARGGGLLWLAPIGQTSLFLAENSASVSRGRRTGVLTRLVRSLSEQALKSLRERACLVSCGLRHPRPKDPPLQENTRLTQAAKTSIAMSCRS
jgi:hypothetical protein